MSEYRSSTPRGLYAVGSAGLAIEAIVLLLAAPAVATLDRGHVPGLGIGYLLLLAVLLVLAAVRLRSRWGKPLASTLQLLVVVSGVVTWPMFIVGAAFLAVWIYWLRQWPS